MNVVVLAGNLTRDMEVQVTKTGYSIGKFGLAVNEKFKQGDEWKDRANFFDCVIWGKRAEALRPYLLKGTKVIVHATARWESWEGDHGKRSKVTFTVQNIEFGGNKKERTYDEEESYEDVTPENFVDEIPFN